MLPARPACAIQDPAPSLLLLEDDPRQIATEARIGVVHAAPVAGTVDVYLAPAGLVARIVALGPDEVDGQPGSPSLLLVTTPQVSFPPVRAAEGLGRHVLVTGRIPEIPSLRAHQTACRGDRSTDPPRRQDGR